MIVKEIKIEHILPCIADTSLIRFIAYIDNDISDILPYLNTKIENAIYNHPGKSITIKKEGRLIGVHARQIAGGKILDIKDAEYIIGWLKDLINYCYDNKDSIEPNYERRQRLQPLDIYKLLPRTNCKRCGELTCLAYAVKLSGEETDIMRCSEIFQGEHTQKRNELLKMLKTAGYSIPNVFAEKEENNED
jgi:ArsR family metal-binding transcriptional regulator